MDLANRRKVPSLIEAVMDYLANMMLQYCTV